MSSGRRSSAGAEVEPIPAGSEKVVQSLKEIVNRSEAEIYAALRDCDMDPNEAVNRLLIQDPFHEVRSKREKKKEGKDTESKFNGSYDNLTRGGKNAGDQYLGHTSSTPCSSFEYAPENGKLAFQKESGSTTQTSSFCSIPAVSGNNKSEGPPSIRDGVVGENKESYVYSTDGETYARQPPYGYRSAWIRSPGQVSMADIVKMGRPHDKAFSIVSSSDLDANHLNIQGPTTAAIQHNFIFSGNHAANVHETGVSLSHNIPSNNEWPSTEKPVDAKTHIPMYSMDSEVHLETSDLVLDSINQHSESEEVQGAEDSIENLGVNGMVSTTEFSRNIPEVDSKSDVSENDLRKDITSYKSHSNGFEQDDVGASASSISRNALPINMKKDVEGSRSDADEFTLIIPDHLLVRTADCSHLRFGSFGSGMSAACSSGAIASSTGKPNLVGKRSVVDISSSVGDFNTRITDSVDGAADRTASNVDVFHVTGSNVGSYDALSMTQQEKIRTENVEVAHGNHQVENVQVAHGKHQLENVEVVHGNHHSFPVLNHEYTFDDVQRLNAALNQSEMSSQIQNLSPFSNVMLSHSNSLASTLLTSNVPAGKEYDHYPPFPVAQSVSAKYGSAVTSVGHSGISASEALKIAGFSSMQSSSPAVQSGTNASPEPPRPHHVTIHPYSQPTPPLGPYTNMIGCSFLPQNYSVMPSAFQQTFTGNSAYQQFLAGILAQYENRISVNSSGQSSTIAPGYAPAPFGNTTTSPGSVLMNPPPPLPGATLSYDGSSIYQYKDRDHLISPQLNGNSGFSLSSRTPSAVQNSAHGNYHGQQNQLYGGFKQGQQPSPDYGTHNVYNSHVGVTPPDQQPQSSRIEFPGRSHFWPNGY